MSGGGQWSERSGAQAKGGGSSGWLPALRLAAALTAGLLWVLVIVDYKVAKLLGVHLFHAFVIRQLLQEDSFRDLALGRETVLSAVAAAAVLGLGHLAVMAAAERWMRRALRPRTAGALLAIGVNLVPVVVASLGGGSAADRWARGVRSLGWPPGSGSPSVRLCYPRPGLAVPALRDRKNVLVVVVESLRGDAFGPVLMPELSELARQGRCLVSERHYSSGHDTNGGLFSILYGLNAYYWPVVNREKARSWPLRVLRENGYHVLAASASPLGGRRPTGFWMEEFDPFEEVVDHNDYQDDLGVVDWFARSAREGQLERPFFALLFLNSTHHNYRYPPEFERFTPVMAANYNHFLGDHALERFRTEIFNRYRNSVLWVDHLLARLIADLRGSIERGELIVAITGDHGEEFWDHGLLGHAASHLIEARTRVPLLLFAAGPPFRLSGVTSHVDILPTVLGQLRAEPPLDPASFSDGVSLLAAPLPPERIAVVSAADRSIGELRLALVGRGRKVVVDAWGVRGPIELRAVSDLDDHGLPAEEGIRALHDIAPSLGEDLDRFIVLQGDECRPRPIPVGRK